MVALLLYFGGSPTASAATVTQTWTLQPGWNSIFVEVQPTDTTPSVIFAGLPVQMVWSYFPTETPVQFIQNPADPPWNVAGWNVYLPPGQTDAAALTNLFAVQARRTYLIKVSGGSTVTLNITGTPVYHAIKWQPDSFTLTGLPIAANATVQSGDYFFNSTAHKSQVRYRLDPNGTWIQLSDTSPLRSGVGYWIFSKGGSDFTAPVELEFDGSDRLDFGPLLETKTLILRNRGAAPLSVDLSNSSAYPLVVQDLDGTGQTIYTPLTTRTVSVPAASSVVLTLGIRRAGLPAASDAILTASAQNIQRKLLVTAQNPIAAAGNQFRGLWLGVVTMNAVSEPHSQNPTQATATTAEFSMRVLLHVDSNGTTRLLKEAFVMKQPNPPGSNLSNPGALVLLSDPALLPLFQTPGNRDSARFAPRVSSVGYEFPGTALVMSGAFGTNLTGSLVTARNSPTNPFKHRYHPDHDDLTAAFLPPPANLPTEQQEVWQVSRAIALQFAAPAADQSPSSGFSVRTGTYSEQITGLHKNTLITSGTFTLQRVNTLGEINPAPAP
ncbi:MAG: hypothetical protein M3Z85_21800 [Acidobacteriota bacterium]|nr:hypothetical protein [Acidobacteriota bacterium]